MAVIINIETSADYCSVSLSEGVETICLRSDDEKMAHARRIGPFIASVMEDAARRGIEIDAIAVSSGPGSYTGLRIGMSAAKGLAFALDKPLICIPTLQIMAVSAMFRRMDIDPDTLLMPMLDARRMEVYTCIYDFALKEIVSPHALILAEGCLDAIEPDRPLAYFGPGAEKCSDMMLRKNGIFIPRINPSAADMAPLSNRMYAASDFADTAYATPFYLKDFQAAKPKDPFANLPHKHSRHNEL